MSFDDVWGKIQFGTYVRATNGFVLDNSASENSNWSEQDKGSIKAALQSVYDGSASARQVLDSVGSAGFPATLKILYEKNNDGQGINGEGGIIIDPNKPATLRVRPGF